MHTAGIELLVSIMLQMAHVCQLPSKWIQMAFSQPFSSGVSPAWGAKDSKSPYLRSSNEWYSQCLALPCEQTQTIPNLFALTSIRKKAHLPTKLLICASYLSWHISTFLSPASSVSAQATKAAAECLRQLRSAKSLWGKCCQSHKSPKCH